ncbi:mitochondrial cardiolipin hydrolase [Echinops telfairi]|uniref:Mitochondrial cardiolipin hydrolase n=1 Tax=Echinops telfairi TaxID=9371 RepID=A0AC55DBW8_ECHTE|nr:mitochondrial cardiolipin hydrolase [Echinops telfairi]
MPLEQRGLSELEVQSEQNRAKIAEEPAGIQVRHDQDLGYMHHKFAIVDKKVLITGSLNWTTQAIQNNRENVLIMEDDEYVRLFLEEFERIWEEFNPTKYTFFPQEKRGH